ncbi:hypothetical protein [Nocardia transvalensis]|uniref:hypothetical protein n=1 Tax=Nocardia transvalensis TaxID=37333 RepID=UPI001E405FD4|nr:hypothetical protein [Nocardia transvalensis]
MDSLEVIAMAIQVVGRSLMASDQTAHQARSVGEGGWVVSFLPGRTLTMEQAVAAIQIAEVSAAVDDLAHRVGLTGLEAVRLAVVQPPWNALVSPSKFRWVQARRSTVEKADRDASGPAVGRVSTDLPHDDTP